MVELMSGIITLIPGLMHGLVLCLVSYMVSCIYIYSLVICVILLLMRRLILTSYSQEVVWIMHANQGCGIL